MAHQRGKNDDGDGGGDEDDDDEDDDDDILFRLQKKSSVYTPLSKTSYIRSLQTI